MTKISESIAEALLVDALENGWRPPSAGEPHCSCHLSAPCSSCCLDGDYMDEFLDEHNLEIAK